MTTFEVFHPAKEKVYFDSRDRDTSQHRALALPSPVPHGVGSGHGFDHEGSREVGHEGEHHDQSGAESPSGAAERCRERQGTRAHDQVEDVDEPGQRGVERRSVIRAR